MPYAVVDFETTGILPSHHHRVIEIGVTHVEDDGSISGRWETLINPMRDLGPQQVHGVRGADLFDAPRFDDIVGDVANLLRNRTFVAHNSSFDVRFLLSEFTRSGFEIGDAVPSICTMSLARSLGVPGRVALDECCAHYGIELVDAHSAGADSYATAQLLGAYLANSLHVPDWNAYWAQVSQLGFGFPYPDIQSNGVVWKPRGSLLSEPVGFLECIADPPLEVAAEGAEIYYLDALDRCLIDGMLSASEASELISLANELGLARNDVGELHLRYYRALVDRAWADGVLTEEEVEMLSNVAELLEIDPTNRDLSRQVSSIDASWSPTKFALAQGDHVVLTGQMQRDRSDWEAVLTSAGYVPHPRVTKKSRLLVAADPDSVSGKAQQARKYGIPVVGEAWLESNL